MLPLHTLAKNFFFFVSILVILTSCRDNSKIDLTAINVLEEGLLNSNKVVNASITDLMISLQSKLNDYSSKERAEIWFPKAKSIQAVSNETIKKIEEIKLETKVKKKFNEDDIRNIVNILSQYQDSILQIDSKLTKDYKRYLRIFSKDIDSLEDNQIEKLRKHFSETSITGSIALLTKIENNIKLNEYGMITYCQEMSTPLFCGFRYLPQAVVIQNSSIVQPKEQIKITAGLGGFSNRESPKIFIYNKPVNVSEDGAAHYKLKAATDPGKYYVPVRIEYIDENGKHNSIQKEIEYTVANIQKQ
jgi:hypothetical protein